MSNRRRYIAGIVRASASRAQVDEFAGPERSEPRNQIRPRSNPMAVRPYLAFAGNAREAFTRYQEIFGGELVLLDMAGAPPEAGSPPAGVKPDAIMHAALTAPVGLLMGADDLGGNFDGTVSGMCVN